MRSIRAHLGSTRGRGQQDGTHTSPRAAASVRVAKFIPRRRVVCLSVPTWLSQAQGRGARAGTHTVGINSMDDAGVSNSSVEGVRRNARGGLTECTPVARFRAWAGARIPFTFAIQVEEWLASLFNQPTDRACRVAIARCEYDMRAAGRESRRVRFLNSRTARWHKVG
jgi:hypothetical protein